MAMLCNNAVFYTVRGKRTKIANALDNLGWGTRAAWKDVKLLGLQEGSEGKTIVVFRCHATTWDSTNRKETQMAGTETVEPWKLASPLCRAQ